METKTTVEAFHKFLKDKMCKWDGCALRNGQIKHYPHDGGVVVNGTKVWLYVECPLCDYQWSFAKLGFEG